MVEKTEINEKCLKYLSPEMKCVISSIFQEDTGSRITVHELLKQEYFNSTSFQNEIDKL